MDLKYSIDMIRLKTNVVNFAFKEYINQFLSCDPSVTFWENFNYNGYRYNWRIEQLDGFNSGDTSSSSSSVDTFSFWVGYRHNMEKPCDLNSYSLVIEYNPNKCMEVGLLGDILDKFFRYEFVMIQSFDIAIDFDGVDVRNTFYDRGKKHQSQDLYFSDNRTYYIGKGNGRVKVYDKACELGLDGLLTRYEVSLSPKMAINEICDYEIDCDLPDLYNLTGGVEDIEQNLKPIVFSLLHGYPMHDLSYYMRNKVKKHLGDNILKIDKKIITTTLLGWVHGYMGWC